MATLINLVVASGQEGLDFLLQEAEKASTQDLMKYSALISIYRHAEDINANVLLDFIDRKGRDASNYEDVAALYTLILNLGFFPDRDGTVEAFLMGLASDVGLFTASWAVMRQPTDVGQFNTARREGLIQGLQSTAITALFHKNTGNTLSFLETLRQNAPDGTYLRSMLDFHFDILKEFPSLEAYVCYLSEKIGLTQCSDKIVAIKSADD